MEKMALAGFMLFLSFCVFLKWKKEQNGLPSHGIYHENLLLWGAHSILQTLTRKTYAPCSPSCPNKRRCHKGRIGEKKADKEFQLNLFPLISFWKGRKGTEKKDGGQGGIIKQGLGRICENRYTCQTFISFYCQNNAILNLREWNT